MGRAAWIIEDPKQLPRSRAGQIKELPPGRPPLFENDVIGEPNRAGKVDGIGSRDQRNRSIASLDRVQRHT